MKEANMLFIDQPVGVGFSYGNKVLTTEEELAADMVLFMKGFYEIHPSLKKLDLFLAGESYCG